MTGRQPSSNGEASALLQLYRALSGVVAELAESREIADACGRLADFGVRHLDADVAGVFRHPRRGGPDLVAATDTLLADLAALRERFPDLPGGTPLADGQTLLITDSAEQAPAWRAVAAQLGLRSALMIGLPALSSGPATLGLYSHRHAAFVSTRSEIAQVARLGGFALRAVEQRSNLEEALRTRDVIGQAQGVLMERYRLNGEQAMAYLRRHSQQSQRPIRQLATEIVERRTTDARLRDSGDPD